MRKYVFFLLGWIAVLNTSVLHAQQKIEVSAFYSDYPLRNINKSNKKRLPTIAMWTKSPYVQVRIKHHIPASNGQQNYKFRSLHLFDEVAPFSFFPVTDLKATDTLFMCTGPKDMAIKVNSHPHDNKELLYSYLSPTTSMLFDKSFPQAFYAIGDMHSWYMTSDSTQDNLQIEFNVDQSLFHLRCSKPLLEDEGRSILNMPAKNTIPSFYLFYLPAYTHMAIMSRDRVVDVLIENIDKTQSNATHITYRQMTFKQEMEPIEKVTKVVEVLNSYLGKERSPDSLYVVVSNQVISKDTIRTVFSRLHQEGKYALLLFHTKHFYEQNLIHELIHTYLKGFPKNEKQLFEHSVFSEAMVEYLASYLYEHQTNELVFKKKEKNMKKNGYTALRAKRLIENNPENEISVTGNEEDKSWIYYDYIPNKMHQYALKTGREEEFARAVAQYLLTLNEKKSPDFDDFSSYMEHVNFQNIKDVFFKFN